MNLGNDFMLSDTGDLVIGSSGDYFTTIDAEKLMTTNEVPYEGYLCLKETIYRIFLATKGGYNPWDITVGGNAKSLISKPINQVWRDFRNNLEEQLLKDDRIQAVNTIEYEIINTNRIRIHISVKPIGTNQVSQFVFPFAL